MKLGKEKILYGWRQRTSSGMLMLTCCRAHWYFRCVLHVDVLGEILCDISLEIWKLKSRLRGSVPQG